VYQKITVAQPQNSTAWHGLGRAYEELAQRTFSGLQRQGPESAYVMALIGESRLKNRQFGSAFFFLKKASDKGSFPGVNSSLAEVYRNTGHAEWARAAESKESPPDCAKNRLACLFGKQQYAAVAKTAARTPEALYWKTKAYNELASQAFAKLLSLPTSAEAHEFRANVHLSQRRYSEAVQELRNALQMSPRSKRLQRELATTLIAVNDLAGASSLLKQLLEQDPESPDLHFILGDVLLRQEQPEVALEHLEASVKARPDLLEARALLGRAYVQVGRGGEAIPHLEAALATDQDGSLHYQLARAYGAAGQQELSREALKKYQELSSADRDAKEAVEAEAQITAP
jgi:predicted Zn-dependent protease